MAAAGLKRARALGTRLSLANAKIEQAKERLCQEGMTEMAEKARKSFQKVFGQTKASTANNNTSEGKFLVKYCMVL